MADANTPQTNTPQMSAPHPSASDPGAPSRPPRFSDEVVAAVVPDAAHPDRRVRNGRVLIIVCSAVVSALLALLFSKGADWFTAEHDTRVSSAADDKVDREGPAFTASVRRNTEGPEAWLFDTPFPAGEERQILGMPKDLAGFTAAHHGRGVFYSDVWNSTMGVAVQGYSEEWLVDVLSDRKASLVVTDMRLKDLRCTPAKARTVIVQRGEGMGSYEGMLFDVARADTPLITGEDEDHYGEPFFTHKKIDLGNGATPGGLRIQVTSGNQDCAWKAFEVTYVDTEGTHKQDITDGGKEFGVRGIAEHPEQVYEFVVTGLVECTPLERGRYTCPGW